MTKSCALSTPHLFKREPANILCRFDVAKHLFHLGSCEMCVSLLFSLGHEWSYGCEGVERAEPRRHEVRSLPEQFKWHICGTTLESEANKEADADHMQNTSKHRVQKLPPTESEGKNFWIRLNDKTCKQPRLKSAGEKPNYKPRITNQKQTWANEKL